MKGQRQPSKLTRETQLKICGLLARFFTPTEIRNTVLHEDGIKLQPTSVSYYLESKSWKSVVERLRSEYLSAIMEVPITHKRVRLERYEQLFGIAQSRNLVGVAKEILNSAREEVEGKASQNTVNILMNKIEMISDDEINDRIIKIKRELAMISGPTVEKFEKSEVKDAEFVSVS